MKFKSGDIVIKTTGGNKMTIFDRLEDGYKCLWFVENSLKERVFKEVFMNIKEFSKPKNVKIRLIKS